MDQNIFNKYDISFRNKVLDWDTSEKQIIKIITANNKYVAMFLNNWRNVSNIDNYLITDIDESLANSNLKIESDSADVDIVMSEGLVDFYDSESYRVSIPLQDFKLIVVAWRDFLLTPPLNGNKV